MNNALVLIVEDAPDISQVLTAYFERDGFRTVVAMDGETALVHHQTLKPDIIILDVGLPKIDGFEVLARLRRTSDVPVIMATAVGDDLDRLSGLRMGADDYVVKPYNPQEVVARARAVLRRGASTGERDVQAGPIRLNPTQHRITVNDTELDLTLSEFRLLSHMIRHPGRVFSRMDLLDSSLAESDALERTVDSHISHLRRKIAQHSDTIKIASVRGIGYRLELRP